MKVGLIAEDWSDIEVIKCLLAKLTTTKAEVVGLTGNGCGAIFRKADRFARQLNARGCKLLILVCDLDERALAEMRAELENKLAGIMHNKKVVVIPVKELEAWLLADHDAINKALKTKKPIKKQSNPEAIRRPKEHLRDLIERASERKVRYVNTIHNAKIARYLSTQVLRRRCASFIPLATFVHTCLM